MKSVTNSLLTWRWTHGFLVSRHEDGRMPCCLVEHTSGAGKAVLVALWPPPWQGESSEQHTNFWLVWHLYLLVVKVSPSAGNPFISRFPSTGLAPLEGVTTYVYLPRYTGSHVTDHIPKGDLGTKELRATSPQTSQFPPYLSKELLISNGYFRLLPGREISHSRNDLGTR